MVKSQNKTNRRCTQTKQNQNFFKDIWTIQNDRSPLIFVCKDGNGTLKTDKQTIDQTQKGNIIQNETEIEQPTYKEVSDIITKLKQNKAPGTDNIPAELIKYGGCILNRRMYKLILLIWTKSNYPQNGCKGLSVQYTKKVNKQYAPITDRLSY
jgi:hypothetical protein